MADDNLDPIAEPAAIENTDPIASEEDKPFTPFGLGSTNWQDSPASSMVLDLAGVPAALSRFGKGFSRAFPDNLGTSPETTKALAAIGLYESKSRYEGLAGAFHAFNELAIETAVRAGKLVMATPIAALHGMEEVGGVTGGIGATGLGLWEAFPAGHMTGYPIGPHLPLRPEPPPFTGQKVPRVTGGIGDRVDLARAQDLGVIGDTPRGPNLEGTPAEVAQRAVPGFTVYHASPYSFDAYSSDHIGTGQGAQSFGHGLYYSEGRGAHTEYLKEFEFKANVAARDAHELGTPERVAREYLLDTRHRGTVAEAIQLAKDDLAEGMGGNSEVLKAAIDLLEEGKVSRVSAVSYTNRINANKEHFLDWDKPLSEQSEYVRNALENHPDLMIAGTAAKWGHDVPAMLDRIGQRLAGVEPGSAAHSIGVGKKETSDALREAGIPGIKYLDQGSRGNAIASLQQQLDRARALVANGEDITGARQNQVRILEVKLTEAENAPQTHNIVLFDATLADITHKNGVPVEPPRPPAPPPDAPVPAAPTNPWRERFEQTVSKLQTTEEFRNLIRKAATSAGEFPAARRGEVPVQQVESIAAAAGMEPAAISGAELGRLMKTDEEVRFAYQGLLHLNMNVHAAMVEHSASRSPQSALALQEAIMHRDIGLEGALEQVVGLRAEWGRTGNALQDFLDTAKDNTTLGDFLKKHKKGMTPEDLQRMADAGAQLDPRTQLPGFLTGKRAPQFWDKFLWYWTNALISGPFTHTKYILANATFAGYDALVTTPIAGLIGKARAVVTEGEIERAYVGEAAARMWGMIAGTPSSIIAAWEAGKSGAMTQLPREITTNSPLNIFTGTKPVGGLAGTAFGLPAHGASAIHTFFRFQGYFAELEAQAYRAAAKEGLSPLQDAFWQRYSAHRDFPQEAAMDKAIESGNKLTFITELGDKGRAFQRFTNTVPAAKLLVPFSHIPINIMKGTYENTLFAVLDKDMRAQLKGERGAIERDQAVARIIGGSAISAMVVNYALNDRLTGAGPEDKNERARWLLDGRQPYSMRIGDRWYSYQRFGPIGDLIGLTANLAESGAHLKTEEYDKAAWMLVSATSKMMMEEVGFQGVYQFVKAFDSERRGASYVSNFMASLLPYSSFLGQTAASMDPYMRETKAFIDGIRYKIPGDKYGRETLYPKRDWTGLPVANNAESLSAVIHSRAVNTNPVDLEMRRLNLHVGPPQDRIGGVKLPPKIYDEYQATAGAMTRMALQHLVENPDWYSLPQFAREEQFKAVIESTRKLGAAIIQMRHPELIQQGVQQRVDHLTGTKPTPPPMHDRSLFEPAHLADLPPEGPQSAQDAAFGRYPNPRTRPPYQPGYERLPPSDNIEDRRGQPLSGDPGVIRILDRARPQ